MVNRIDVICKTEFGEHAIKKRKKSKNQVKKKGICIS